MKLHAIVALPLVALFTVVAWLPLTHESASAQDDAVSPTVRWIDGWSAGRKVARERGKPMLVYVGRHSPY